MMGQGRSENMTASIKGILALALLLLAASTGPARAEEFTVDLGEPGSLAMDVAPYWSQDVRSPGDGLPPTILLRKDDGEQFAMLITPLWAMPGAEPDFGTPASVRRIVESSASEIAPGAVEEQLVIEPIGGEKTGFMFFATDKSLVGRTPPPDEYLYLMQGAVMVGKLLCTFTVLMNDRPSPDAEQALEMLRNAAHRVGA
jgi:hypothetical protein